MTAHNITAAELEKLLAEVTPGEWNYYFTTKRIFVKGYKNIADIRYTNGDADGRLMSMAPTLARKVIAAENLVDLVRDALEDGAITEWQTVALVALDAWEAAQ